MAAASEPSAHPPALASVAPRPVVDSRLCVFISVEDSILLVLVYDSDQSYIIGGSMIGGKVVSYRFFTSIHSLDIMFLIILIASSEYSFAVRFSQPLDPQFTNLHVSSCFH